MARDFAKDFYRSSAWKACRLAFAKSKADLCEDCLAKGLYVPGRIVHHKTHLTPQNINDPSITLSWDNLKLVCMDCHAAEHSNGERRYTFDELGNVVEV